MLGARSLQYVAQAPIRRRDAGAGHSLGALAGCGILPRRDATGGDALLPGDGFLGHGARVAACGTTSRRLLLRCFEQQAVSCRCGASSGYPRGCGFTDCIGHTRTCACDRPRKPAAVPGFAFSRFRAVSPLCLSDLVGSSYSSTSENLRPALLCLRASPLSLPGQSAAIAASSRKQRTRAGPGSWSRKLKRRK